MIRQKFPVVTDIVERVGSTFIGAVLTAWVSSGLDWQHAFTPGSVRTYVGAGALAVFSLIKGMAATFVNRRNGQATSASLAPSVQLEPVPASE